MRRARGPPGALLRDAVVSFFLLLLLSRCTHAALPLPAAPADDVYEYAYSWQGDAQAEDSEISAGPGGWTWGPAFHPRRPACVPIPPELRLCHGIGYASMRLPNLLDHDSMGEVLQQAGAWVPLLARRCHPDARLLLCALFAPVCLARPVAPCRALCASVRAACAPLMDAFGFPWPEMLRCERFPLDRDLCIGLQFQSKGGQHAAQPASELCPQCESDVLPDTIADLYCASEFALRMRIKEVRRTERDRRVIGSRKRRRILRAGPLRPRDLRRLVLTLKNGARCSCPQLDAPRGAAPLLVMGRRAGHRLLLTAAFRLDGGGGGAARAALRRLKGHACPALHSAL
ncbi:secreted frizzled-related protein 5-like [Lampetra fluviatilis]